MARKAAETSEPGSDSETKSTKTAATTAAEDEESVTEESVEVQVTVTQTSTKKGLKEAFRNCKCQRNIKLIIACVLMVVSVLFGIVALGGTWVVLSYGLSLCVYKFKLVQACVTCSFIDSCSDYSAWGGVPQANTGVFDPSGYASVYTATAGLAEGSRVPGGGAWVFVLLFFALLAGIGSLILLAMLQLSFSPGNLRGGRHYFVLILFTLVHTLLAFFAWFFYCIIVYTDDVFKLPNASAGYGLGFCIVTMILSAVVTALLIISRREAGYTGWSTRGIPADMPSGEKSKTKRSMSLTKGGSASSSGIASKKGAGKKKARSLESGLATSTATDTVATADATTKKKKKSKRKGKKAEDTEDTLATSTEEVEAQASVKTPKKKKKGDAEDEDASPDAEAEAKISTKKKSKRKGGKEEEEDVDVKVTKPHQAKGSKNKGPHAKVVVEV